MPYSASHNRHTTPPTRAARWAISAFSAAVVTFLVSLVLLGVTFHEISWASVSWIFTGENSSSDATLLLLRAAVVVIVVSMVIVVVLTALGIRKRVVLDRLVAEHLDQTLSFTDEMLWRVGDRTGWVEDGEIKTGVITELRRRRFTFDGAVIEASSHHPGVIVRLGDSNTLVAREVLTISRLRGDRGPSGTVAEVNQDILGSFTPGDRIGWSDHKGEHQEGRIVEVNHAPFTVRGVRADASPQRPGFVVARDSDGVLIALSDGDPVNRD